MDFFIIIVQNFYCNLFEPVRISHNFIFGTNSRIDCTSSFPILSLVNWHMLQLN